MTPVHHAGNDQAIDIAENFVERLAFFGRLRRKPRPNRARSRDCGIRRNGQRLDIFAKIRDPIRKLMQLFAEFLRRRVTKRLSSLHLSGQKCPRITRIKRIIFEQAMFQVGN